MEIKKILWPTDLSENASQALPYVTSLTRKYQAQVYLLCMAEDLSHHDRWYGVLNTSHIMRLREWEMQGRKNDWRRFVRKNWLAVPITKNG